jgi:hypothetical protein
VKLKKDAHAASFFCLLMKRAGGEGAGWRILEQKQDTCEVSKISVAGFFLKKT